jgi:acetoin utilization deacetylase AcuC-like enzyme
MSLFVVDSVLVGRNRNAFCVVRPPGHHAGVNGLLDGGESCGFCIFNNVAAGALYAISDDRLLCDRCAIVDIDVHHGNGTEEIVQKCHDPSKLFFFSIHLYDNEKKKRGTNNAQYKFYPGTGSEDDLAMNIINVPIVPLWKEQGPTAAPTARKHNTRQKTRSSADSQDESPLGTPKSGNGNGRGSDGGSETGSNNNLSPKPANVGLSGRLAYRKAIQDRLLPALRAFNPDLILISAGFDACKGDVGNARHERGGKERLGLDLEPEDYAWTTNKILEIADICCQGRVVSVLEGGYGRTAIPPAAAPAAAAAGTGSNNNNSAAGGGDDLVVPVEASLDRTIFADCAIRHLHAMIDPYDMEHRFTALR